MAKKIRKEEVDEALMDKMVSDVKVPIDGRRQIEYQEHTDICPNTGKPYDTLEEEDQSMIRYVCSECDQILKTEKKRNLNHSP